MLKDLQATGLTRRTGQTLPGQSRHSRRRAGRQTSGKPLNRFTTKFTGQIMAIQQTGVLGQRQLSTGGNPVTQGNKWGFGNGGVVWNGPGPAPTGQAAIDGINQMMAGSMFQGASFYPWCRWNLLLER